MGDEQGAFRPPVRVGGMVDSGGSSGRLNLAISDGHTRTAEDISDVGHQIEYLASVPEPVVRRWLDRLSGFHYSDVDDPMRNWEGQLASGGTFWAHMAPTVCNFSLGMKYSGLVSAWPPAVDFARRFESEFWEEFGPIPLLRLDEFLMGEWFRAVGRDWWEVTQPVKELWAWLQSRDGHSDWLAPETRDA